jgi:hypothetical protein
MVDLTKHPPLAALSSLPWTLLLSRRPNQAPPRELPFLQRYRPNQAPPRELTLLQAAAPPRACYLPPPKGAPPHEPCSCYLPPPKGALPREPLLLQHCAAPRPAPARWRQKRAPSLYSCSVAPRRCQGPARRGPIGSGKPGRVRVWWHSRPDGGYWGAWRGREEGPGAGMGVPNPAPNPAGAIRSSKTLKKSTLGR